MPYLEYQFEICRFLSALDEVVEQATMQSLEMTTYILSWTTFLMIMALALAISWLRKCLLRRPVTILRLIITVAAANYDSGNVLDISGSVDVFVLEQID